MVASAYGTCWLASGKIRNYTHAEAIANGVLVSDATVLRDTEQALKTAERVGDDVQLFVARALRGVNLIHQTGREREASLELLMESAAFPREQHPNPGMIPAVDIYIAKECADRGDIDGAIERNRDALDSLFTIGPLLWIAPAIAVLVEALLRRGSDRDLREARAAIDRLAAVPTDPGFVLYEIWLLRLRALLARAHGDDTGYRNYRDRYRAMATELGFEGHMKWAEAMP